MLKNTPSVVQRTNENCYFPFFFKCNQRIKIIPRRRFIGYVRKELSLGMFAWKINLSYGHKFLRK